MFALAKNWLSRKDARRTPYRKIRPIARYRPCLEGMEDRTLPSVTVPVPGTPGPVVITGQNSPDEFVIRLEASTPTNIQFSDNGGQTFTTAALADVTGVTVNGLGGRDSLTIDNSNGLVADALRPAFETTNLVSDEPGVAPITDPNLINAWGLAPSPIGTFWVSSNGADLSTIYTGDIPGTPLAKSPLEVTIPGGAPTGQVFNTTTDFDVSNGTTLAPAFFLFASEAGTVSGWNAGTDAQLAFTSTDDSIYKGIALGNNGTANFLYLADFHNNEIDVLDADFNEVSLAGSFTDPNLPAGFAAFNVAIVNNQLLVTYARQDADREDDVPGPGDGFINVFDLNGNFVKRLVSNGALNAPWGMEVASASFGSFSGDLLVGNFGDGTINAYDLTTGAFQGTLRQASGEPIVVDGLWDIKFGNGAAGTTDALYFTAGPDDETHGLFGKITVDGTETVGLPIVFNGGPGLNTLIVEGDSGVTLTESFTPGTTIRSGTLDISSATAGVTIDLNNVSGVIDSTPADSLTFTVDEDNRIIDIFRGKPINGDQSIRVRGPRAADVDFVDDRRDSFMSDDNVDSNDDEASPITDDGLRNDRGMIPYTFTNKTNVTITATAGSQLFIINAKHASDGLETLTIDGGSGFDVAVQPHLPAGVDVNLLNIERTDSSQADSLIDRLYQARLDRLPSQQEVNAWRSIFQSRGQLAVARGIEESVEARTNLVRGWYVHFLGRAAGNGEEQGWIQLLVNGATELEVMRGIVGSPEFFARAQSLFNTGNANQNFVTAAYQVILNRTASSQEITAWLNALPQIGVAGLVTGFLESVEFRANAIGAFYTVLLGRTGDPAGLNGWIGSGLDLGDVREMFEASEEFFDSK